MKTLTITHTTQDHVEVITLDGILNADTASELDDLLKALSGKARPCLLLNVAQLSHISSAGIGCFIGIIKLIRSKGGDIHFLQMQPKVRRVFSLLDMDDFFKFFSDPDQAFMTF